MTINKVLCTGGNSPPNDMAHFICLQSEEIHENFKG